MKIIDLRSDTVTVPTSAMREAMHTAAVGDDVFGDDPTVHDLETRASAMIGKEAALFTASGTMSNVISVLVTCKRGDEVILGDASHMFLNEAGAMSALAGAHPHTIPNHEDGTLDLDDIRNAIRGNDEHWPRTRVVCLENTHNRCFGAVLTPDYTASVAEITKEHGLFLYLDGARIFNAAVALKKDVKEFTRHVDATSFCLSKGLSAPIGSIICGSREFIHEARRARKMLGGGMRQVGVIAAPGIIALDQMIERLEEDHQTARILADGIAQISRLRIESGRVCTNIVYFDLAGDAIDPDAFLAQVADHGVWMCKTGTRRFRMVTHHGITKSDVHATVSILHNVIEKKEARPIE
ncbi:low-specificity L-threonine aldolase [candidate division WOR-3 bacterium]|nr:low-specificity L-threonine aldolase [candidate division WOR-3 bacterium]